MEVSLAQYAETYFIVLFVKETIEHTGELWWLTTKMIQDIWHPQSVRLT